MTREKAAKLFELYLKNMGRGLTIEDIFDLYCIVSNPVERDRELIEFKRLINDAKAHGQAGYEIVNYLTAKRDTIQEITINGGKIESVVETEGDPVFDPSGKTDLSSFTGSSDFEFGDSSVNKPTPVPASTEISPTNVPVFDDSETNDLKIVTPGEKEELDFPNSSVNSFGETNSPASMDNNSDDDGFDDRSHGGPLAF